MDTVIDEIYRSHAGRILATLIRLLGDVDRAEEARQDAFAAAAQQWTPETMPANPIAWLVSAGRFRAIDQLRRRTRFDASARHIVDSLYPDSSIADSEDGQPLEDDVLRLIFICCHPLLPIDAQMAMALREICGLTTEAIAHAFLVPAPTVAQRIVRAKNRIRTAGIAYEIPDSTALPARLGSVLHVIYLLFNEGYLASSGTALLRADLAAEALRLGRILVDLLPHPEARGLLALMLLQDSRRAARSGPAGELILLADQDRSQWRAEMIAEGLALTAGLMREDSPGPYALQAAIAAEHARASTAADTDWRRIGEIYDVLLAGQPSPVIALNRAVAVSMYDGPASALAIVDAILARGALTDFHLAHAARADFLRQLERPDEARQAYQAALALCRQQQERDFLQKRLAELCHREYGS